MNSNLLRSGTGLRLKLPLLLLVTLLQRTPAVRVISALEEMVIASPLGAILKSAAAALASLGAVHSLAGATTLVSTKPSPATVTVGQEITPIGFVVTDTVNIGSWRLGGSLPPGLRLTSADGSGELTGPGTLDATTPGEPDGYGDVTGGNGNTVPLLVGTPTVAGNFTITLQAVQGPLGYVSSVFNYTVNVAASGQPGTAPAFSTQPSPQSVTVGASVTLSAAASGSPAPTYQWQKNDVAIAGATNATLTLSNVQLSDAGTYRVVATNSAGSSTSTPVTVAVSNPTGGGTAPSIARSPGGRTVSSGSTVVFSVDASGTPAPTYQWRKDNAAISGATTRTLIISGATAANAGAYSVVVTNSAGSVTTTPVNLAVPTEPRFGHLSNLSIRTTMVGNETSFTVGTYVGGGTSASMPLLIRAVGPSLSAFGLAGIADTKVVVSGGGQVVASNDNWDGNPTLTALFPTVGAFALSGTKDGVVYQPTTVSGAYTIEVSAVGSPSGEVIAELYDAASSSAFSGAGLRLINVSVRKDVAADGTLTAGFYVDGVTARTLLVRAIGPGLTTNFGIQGTMPDPRLTLFSGQEIIAENDNWEGDAQLTAIGQSVGAFTISSPTTKDAMLVVTLAPGAYTAAVEGTGGGGNVLVEVYEVQ